MQLVKGASIWALQGYLTLNSSYTLELFAFAKCRSLTQPLIHSVTHSFLPSTSLLITCFLFIFPHFSSLSLPLLMLSNDSGSFIRFDDVSMKIPSSLLLLFISHFHCIHSISFRILSPGNFILFSCLPILCGSEKWNLQVLKNALITFSATIIFNAHSEQKRGLANRNHQINTLSLHFECLFFVPFRLILPLFVSNFCMLFFFFRRSSLFRCRFPFAIQ